MTEPTDPPLDTLLDVVRSVLEWPQTDDRTRSVAILSLTSAAGNRCVSMERLLDMAAWLTANNTTTNCISELRQF